MTLLRRHLTPSIIIALTAAFYGCGGDKLTLPGEGQATKIEAVTGNAQAGIAGTALPLPLVVKVTDELGRPVSGQNVQYTVTGGGGQVAPGAMQTGADGRASATWTLGLNAGDQAVEAKAVGGGAPDDLTQAFSATAIAGSGTLIAAVSGDDQSAPVNSALGQPLVVRVSDGNGNPVSGITIAWTVQNGGSITPESVVTGDDGLASASRVLGPAAGQQSAQASGDALTGSPVTFVQTAEPSNPTTLTEVSGNGQAAPAGFEVAQDLVVRLTDGNGNGVGGQAINWVITGGGGTPNPTTSTTDPTGLARSRWTLGAAAGGNSLNAVFSGLAGVVFNATASADVPTTLAVASGDNQSAAAGASLPNPLAVKVTDANNNPVANVSVTWTANDGGSVSGGTSATNAQGIAQITRTLGVALGAYTTTAVVDGLAGSPVTFTSTATVGAAAKIVIITPPSTTAANGAVFATQPVVQVQDAAGNNVGPAGRVITASVLNPPPGSPLKGDLSKDTDANGLAAFTDLNIVGPVQTYTLRFRSGALTEARADVLVTAGAVSGGTSTVTASPVSVQVADQSTITVTAKDAGGNPVSGATVVLGVTGSGINTLGQPAAPTDVNGITTGTFSSTGLGAHTITATIGGVAVTDNAVVTVGTGGPASVAAQAGDGQSAQVGTAVGVDPSVIIRDAGSNPVSGVQVTFAVASGGGSVAGGTATTNGSGIATVGSWTLGSTAGTNNNTLTATVTGSGITGNPVTFTASATVGGPSATQSTLTANPLTITAGGSGSTITVTARDGSGNLIQGANVVFSANGGGTNTFTPLSGVTNGSGVATSTYTGSAAGDHTIGATIAGVIIDATEVVTVQAGAPANLTFSAPPPPLVVGTSTQFSVAVNVTDSFGNPTNSTVVLTLNQPSGGSAVLGGTTSLPSVGGSAAFPDLTVSEANGVGESYSLTASVSGASPVISASFIVSP